MYETKPKKMVSRNVAIALGVICIVLVALIAYFTVTGISAQNSYNNLQNQIANQNETISQLESNITNLQNQIAIDNATITSLANSINSTLKIASVTKVDGWYSTFHEFNFTVQVANNGTIALNNITVVITLYHDWMNVTWPIDNYTNEIESYQSPSPGPGVNTLYFGTVPPGGNENQTISFSDGDQSISYSPVPVNYAIVTLSIGTVTLSAQTLQNIQNNEEQTWVFP